jgi:Uma2 family endonuclease
VIAFIIMIDSESNIYISPEDYLEGEKISLVKHEYIQGQVYAMAGASDAHNLITTNLLVLLKTHLRGKGCLPLALHFYYRKLLKTLVWQPLQLSSAISK